MFWILLIGLSLIIICLLWNNNVKKYKYLQFIGWLFNSTRNEYINLYFHTKNRSFVAINKDGIKKVLDDKQINSGKIVTFNGIKYRIIFKEKE